MLFKLLQKQKDLKKQKKLVETMILSLNIPDQQKTLYIEAIKVLTESELELLFSHLTKFIEKIEMKHIDQIRRDGFESIAWMRKKEAEEKAQEINSFSFLLHNL